MVSSAEAASPTFFGLHMANDPSWKDPRAEDQAAPRMKTRSAKQHNFVIRSDLAAVSTKVINVGDELLLDYNYGG